ncbi:MAG: hypothetical protein Kow006_09950 [Gammaproteobacteria bacterium]
MWIFWGNLSKYFKWLPVLFAWFVLTGAASEGLREVRIGVLAFRGAEHALASWTPTAEYLSRAIPGFRFRVVPLPLQALEEAAADKTIDYVFTNSGQYVVLEQRFGLSRLATVKKPLGDGIRNVFGGVIFKGGGLILNALLRRKVPVRRNNRRRPLLPAHLATILRNGMERYSEYSEPQTATGSTGYRSHHHPDPAFGLGIHRENPRSSCC